VTRATLENFWSLLHAIMTITLKYDGFSKDETHRILQIIIANQSAEYHQAVEAEEAKVLAEIEQLKTLSKGFRHLALSHGETATTTSKAKLKHEKTKT
jgi:hypothetical protein